MHRLRLAVGRAADDRDVVGQVRGLAHRPDDDELAEALDHRLGRHLHRWFDRQLAFAVPFADQRLELLHRRVSYRGWPERSCSTPALSRIAAMRAAGTCPFAQDHRPRPGAVDHGRGRPAVRRAAVEDQVDRVPELGEDLRGVARLGQAGDIGRGRRQRPDGRRERPGSRVIRDAQPDRRGPAGQHGGQRDVRALRDHDGQPARPARVGECRRGRRHHPDRGRLGCRLEQQHDPCGPGAGS